MSTFGDEYPQIVSENVCMFSNATPEMNLEGLVRRASVHDRFGPARGVASPPPSNLALTVLSSLDCLIWP